MASSDWHNLTFKEFLQPVERRFKLADDVEYRLCGVRWYGKGAFIREVKFGREVKLKGKNIIHAGDVVFSKLFAWKGSFAVIENGLDGCCVSDEFPIYHLDETILLPRYLHWYFQTERIRNDAERVSKGVSAASRFRLNEKDFANLELPTPPLAEQRRIVARIDALAGRFDGIRKLQTDADVSLQGLLLNAYYNVIKDAPYFPIADVAPLVRRRVEIDPDRDYPELGVRSFGKGTFHKPAIKGSGLNGKRLYAIEVGDLVLNNVFAWEGAVAVVRPEDHGRFGSHRFITIVPKQGIATSEFLYFHFTSAEGLQALQDASPGAAGRNRTLGLKALEKIQVPIPPIERQMWFNAIQAKADAVKELANESARELDALLPSVLDKAFRGEL